MISDSDSVSDSVLFIAGPYLSRPLTQMALKNIRRGALRNVCEVLIQHSIEKTGFCYLSSLC